MSPNRFTNFFKNTNADKHGVFVFCHSFKTSQNYLFLFLPNRFTNFVFLTHQRSLILSASAKSKKPQKFANRHLNTKSKSIYELFLKGSSRQNKALWSSHPLQLSKSEYKKAAICELLENRPTKAELKIVFATIKLL